jgi:hypothetical protein
LRGTKVLRQNRSTKVVNNVGIDLVWIKSGHIKIWETTLLQFFEIRLTLRKHLTYRRSEKRCFWIEPSVDGTMEKLGHSPLVTISILIDSSQRCLNPQDKFGNSGSFTIESKLATFMNNYSWLLNLNPNLNEICFCSVSRAALSAILGELRLVRVREGGKRVGSSEED